MTNLRFIVKGIAESIAKTQADLDLRSAGELVRYQLDPVLSRFPVPRPTVKDVELDLSFAVQSLGSEVGPAGQSSLAIDANIESAALSSLPEHVLQSLKLSIAMDEIKVVGSPPQPSTTTTTTADGGTTTTTTSTSPPTTTTTTTEPPLTTTTTTTKSSSGGSIEHMALYANTRLAIGSGAKIELSLPAAACGSGGERLHRGQAAFELGTRARIAGHVYNIGDALLRSSSRVTGDLITTEEIRLEAGARVEGDRLDNSIVLPSQIPTYDAGHHSRRSIQVGAGSSESIRPGDYDALIVGSAARIGLRSGRYRFNSITLGPRAVLVIDDEPDLEFLVAGSMIFGDEVRIEYRGHAPRAAHRALFYTGARGDLDFNTSARLFGTFVAPNCRARLRSNSTLTGRLWADDIDIGSGCVVRGDA